MANEDYLNLRLNQFLDSITNKKKQFELTVDNQKIFGTLTEIQSFISTCSNELRKKLEPLFKDATEYEVEYELSDIEIYNYLENVTSNFDELKTKIVLRDVEVYYTMDFLERIHSESIKIYRQEGWEIPVIKYEPTGKFKGITMPDYDKMGKKTHPFEDFNILRVKSILNKKLEKVKDESVELEQINENLFPEIFKEKGYDLFCFLNEKYTKDDNSRKAKYSNLFWFLEYEDLLNCTQLEYIKFISSEYNETMSKIQPKTTKYYDTIQPLLKRYWKGQS